jgi:hypothetical protein
MKGKIRVWRLGYFNRDEPSKSLIPTQGAINKLRDVLASNNTPAGCTTEIVWGPELDVQEYSDLKVINLIETSPGKYEEIIPEEFDE